jgi:hypothetical protein
MGEAKFISFLFVRGVRLIVQLGIVVFAILAAKRHQLPGLWILAVAAALTALQAIANVMISSPFLSVEHDNMMKYYCLVEYSYYVTMFVALCGWCVLAFSQRPSRSGCNPRVPQAGSLSLGGSAMNACKTTFFVGWLGMTSIVITSALVPVFRIFLFTLTPAYFADELICAIDPSTRVPPGLIHRMGTLILLSGYYCIAFIPFFFVPPHRKKLVALSVGWALLMLVGGVVLAEVGLWRIYGNWHMN